MISILPDVLQYRAHTHPERTAYMFEGKMYDYAGYYRATRQTAAYLQSIGVKKGDRIGILDLNTPEAIHLITGAMSIGAIPVTINWKCVVTELTFILRDAGIQHFFYGEAFAKLIELANLPGDLTIIQTNALQSVYSNQETAPLPHTATPDDVCVILYTSGTTGDPKGVMLTYRNIYHCYTYCSSDTPSFGPDTRNLVCGPLYSIFGFGAFFACIYAGATNILMRMFDPQLACKIIANARVSNALLVPVMIKMILAAENVEKDFSSLKHIQYGGSPVSADLLREASDKMNCYFTQVYGLTESAGIATSLRYDDHEKILRQGDANEQLLSSAGKPGIGIDIKIVDDGGTICPPNEPGEVWIKGENISPGYWNAHMVNESTFASKGWCQTGDIGYLDEAGFLFLVDRKNDKIVSKGVNIYPAEIEKVLEQHPAFKEVAVVGIPDKKAGEVVCVVAVLKDEPISLDDLCSWCESKIAINKLPKRLDYAEALPRTPTGKILRKLIREPYWKNETRRIHG